MNECPYKTWIEKSEELWRKREDMMTSKMSSLGCSMNDEARKWLELAETNIKIGGHLNFRPAAEHLRRLLEQNERLETTLSGTLKEFTKVVNTNTAVIKQLEANTARDFIRFCQLEADNAALQRQVEGLREALFQHRADLHGYSKRPCATCRNSAKALGISKLVPDSCSPAWNSVDERKLKAIEASTREG